MKPQQYITVEIPGHPYQSVPAANLPPVGTRFMVHKHLTDGGTYMKLEVTSHEWTLEEAPNQDSSAFFSVTVRTRRID